MLGATEVMPSLNFRGWRVTGRVTGRVDHERPQALHGSPWREFTKGSGSGGRTRTYDQAVNSPGGPHAFTREIA